MVKVTGTEVGRRSLYSVCGRLPTIKGKMSRLQDMKIIEPLGSRRKDVLMN